MQVFSFAELKLCQYVWRNTVRMHKKWPSSWKSILRYNSTVLSLHHSTHLSISEVFALSHWEVKVWMIMHYEFLSNFKMQSYSYYDELLQVQKVMYPGLPSHPQHQIARKQMKMFSGMIAAEIRGGVQGGKILVEVCVVSNHQHMVY